MREIEKKLINLCGFEPITAYYFAEEQPEEAARFVERVEDELKGE